MKNILIINTGGTIGSHEENGVISSEKGKCRILELYNEAFPGSQTEFTTVEPYNILSENLETLHWEMLIHFIISIDKSCYDGIIITHGSDTLSYTSAMLGMCLHNLGIPIVITASDYVPDHPQSNALDNFSASVKLINNCHNGVYTVYKNRNDNSARVFIPTRMQEADRFNDRFSETDGLPFGFINNEGCQDILCKIRHTENKTNSLELSSLRFSKNVLSVHPYPSINWEKITPDDNTGAVLLITYHSGTVPEKAEFLLEKCLENKIPLFLCSLKKSSKAIYETSSNLLKKGALPLYNMSTESAYAKLLLAVNLSQDNIAEFMKKDIYFETIQPE